MLQNDKIELTILRTLLLNEEYCRKVIPYLKLEYFTDNNEKIVYETIFDFFTKYNALPTVEILNITLGNKKTDDLNEILIFLNENNSVIVDQQWLLDQTEELCKNQAIYNAVLKSINILDDKKTSQDKGIIPKLLADALGVSFDTNIGHDYIEDAEDRFEYYHRKENKIPFDIDWFNKITKDGVTPKTLNLIAAGINVGKSLMMCHLAASYLSAGYDVVYFTMEMAEEQIAKRIDANLYNMDINDVLEISKDVYMKRMEKLKNKITGKLIIKEYPTASSSVIQFRAFLNELYLKKSFRPKICFFDYINICSSSRIKMGGNAGLYQYVKTIAEELRGLMVEMEMVGWTATQLNRDGMKSSDPTMTETAESMGLPATVDFMLIAVTNEELEDLMQYQINQVKNRYGDVTKYRKFVIGVDRAKQKLYNVDDSQQNLTSQSKPVMDATAFGERDENDTKKSKFRQLITG